MQWIKEDPELKKAYHEGTFALNQKFVFLEDFANSFYRERNVIGYSKTCTTIELAQSVLARVLSYLNRNCQMYFICCDIRGHVPMRKHATQAKRKAQQQKSDKQPYPANCVLMPDGISVWGAAPQHIEIDRMAITPYLRYAFLSWIRDNIQSLNFPVPSGKCLVLDFDKEGPVTFCNGQLRRWPAYAHGCGEYDSMVQFYSTLFLRDTNLSVVLSTPDSDVLTNMLWTMEDLWPEISHKKDPKVIWYSRVTNEKKGAHVDVRMLHEKVVEYMLKRNPDAKKPVFPVDKSKPRDRSEERNAVFAFILATSLCGADCTVEKAFLSYQVPFYKSPNGRASTQKKKQQKQKQQTESKKKGSKSKAKRKNADDDEETDDDNNEQKEEKEETDMQTEPGSAAPVANDRADVISTVRKFLHLIPFCHLSAEDTKEQRWRDEYYPHWPLPQGWSKQQKLSGTMSLQNPTAPPTPFQALGLIMGAIRALKPTRSAEDDRVKSRLKKQQSQLEKLEQLLQDEDDKKLQIELRAMRAEQRSQQSETKDGDKDGDARMEPEPVADGKDEKKGQGSGKSKTQKAKSSTAQVEQRPSKRRKTDNKDASESKESSEEESSVDERLAKLLKDNGIVLVTEEQIRAEFPTAEEAMSSVLFDAAYLTPAMNAFAPGPFNGLDGGELIG